MIKNTITREEFKKDLLSIIFNIDERIYLGLLQQSKPYEHLDSLDITEMTAGIEEKYGLEIPEQSIENAYANKKVNFEGFVSSWYDIYMRGYEQKVNRLLKNI
ncbi:hypothetical protein HYU21_02530 [Candidatus Woesearchaeota archaeon]|nr:hypothetical protein [Candidatus Woesearchaeota archaeon]